MDVTIKLADGEESTGAIINPATEGDLGTINLHDENGMGIQQTGIVIEILEKFDWSSFDEENDTGIM